MIARLLVALALLLGIIASVDAKRVVLFTRPFGSGAHVTFDAVGAFANTNGVVNNDYSGPTIGGTATYLLAFISQQGTDTVSSVTWDNGGTNQAMSLAATQNLRASVPLIVYSLLNPTTGAGKTLRVVMSGASSTLNIAAMSFIGGHSVSVQSQGVSGATAISFTDNLTVGGNHMGVIFDRGDFVNSNTASWTPAADASSNGGGQASRPAILHGLNTFSLQITFDIADNRAFILLDVSP